jgi:hypothetical protein
MCFRQRPILRIGPQQFEASLIQIFASICDQRGQDRNHGDAQSLAVGTHPLGTIEAEQLRAGWLIADTAMGTGIVRAVECFDVGGRGGSIFDSSVSGLFRSSSRGLRPTGPAAARPRLISAPGFSSWLMMTLPPDNRTAFSTASASRVRLPGTRCQPINNNFDRVSHLAIELQVLGQMNNLTIDPSP